MVESGKKTFTGHLASILTPERFVWVIAILIGATVSTTLKLDNASDLIATNASKNIEQDDELDEMDDIQRQYALDINTLTINLDQIKDMIRGL